MNEIDLEEYALVLPGDEETQEWKQKFCELFGALNLPKNQQVKDALELLGGYVAIARKNAFLQGFEMALKMQKSGVTFDKGDVLQ